MQTAHDTNYPNNKRLTAGGRIASDALRDSKALADEFTGLEQGVNRYNLLLLVKKVGKSAGFTPRMIQLLDYYMAFTRDVDWEEGSRPLVYQSISRTSLDLSVSERQVQKLEAALFNAGAITWHDSGNHKRYGQRCTETGRIVYAFGVDLTPLAYLREQLEDQLAEKKLHDDAWLHTKREISSLRAQLRAMLAEWRFEEGSPSVEIAKFEQRYDEVAVQIRTHIDLKRMRALLHAHQTLLSDVMLAMGVGAETNQPMPTGANLAKETHICSPRSEAGFAHYKSTTQEPTKNCSRNDPGFQESVAASDQPNRRPSRGAESTAMEHVTLGMAISAASPRLAAHLPADPSWADLVQAAYRVREELGVSQESWARACSELGRNGAAVCLLVADRATLREVDPVRTPPAYFRGMVRRSETGELRLCRSLFALLQRDERGTCAA